MSKATGKYLAHYAEAELQWLPVEAKYQFDHALIIPAFNEQPDFLDRLQPLFNKHALLVILVINQPDNLTSPTAENLALTNHISKQTPVISTKENLSFHKVENTNSYILVVNRYSADRQIPEKQGVGLARKIAADIAVKLYAQQQLKSPIIFSTDCDTRLPADYFARITTRNNENHGAYTFPFTHSDDQTETAIATRLYEFSLRYYQAGLAYAGSPYAFHTIGSTLAFNVEAYCKVRGFPLKSGGEDFYLLNKIAKVSGVCSLSGKPIEIFPRLSDRVPFGTGPATRKIIDQSNNREPFQLYNPEIFDHLKQLLDVIKDFQANPLAEVLEMLNPYSQQTLLAMGMEKAVAHAVKQSGTDSSQFLKQIHTWFDGFRTLKYIHSMRDTGLPDISLQSLGKSSPDWVKELPGYRPALDSAI